MRGFSELEVDLTEIDNRINDQINFPPIIGAINILHINIHSYLNYRKESGLNKKWLSRKS